MPSIINADTTNGVVITSDTSGEIELQANGVTKAKITANGLQDANGASLRGGSFRNLLINGDMQIAQRGTSSTGQTAGGYLTVDRWKFNIATAGTWSMTQDSDVPTGQGFANSMKMSCTTADASLAAGDRVWFDQRIEGQNLQHLKYGTTNAKKITLSFWAKSNKTGTYILELYSDDSNKQVSKSYTINTADTWEKKTITVDGDTSNGFNNDNNLSLYVWFYLAAGSNYTSGTLNTSWAAATTANRAVGQVNLADSTSNYINITGLQLEVGSGASDFEFLPYDVQLQRCLRYYEKITGTQFACVGSGNTESGWGNYYVKFTTIMRANPTITQSDLYGFPGGSGAVAVTGIRSSYGNTSCTLLQLFHTASAGLAVICYINSTSGYLDMSAEL